MKNIEIFILKQSRRTVFIALFLPLFLVLVSDLYDNKKIFESFNSILVYLIFLTIPYLFYSLFFKNIILTKDVLVVKYPLIMSWRNKHFLINDMKNITILKKVKYPVLIIEVFENEKVRKYNFYIAGFNLTSFDSLYYELRKHACNKLDLNIE